MINLVKGLGFFLFIFNCSYLNRVTARFPGGEESFLAALVSNCLSYFIRVMFLLTSIKREQRESPKNKNNERESITVW